jgi:hypothetical protein
MLQQTYAGVDPIFLEWLCFNKENPVNCWDTLLLLRKRGNQQPRLLGIKARFND